MSKLKFDWQTSASLGTIQKRAQMFYHIRAFFDVRDVLEVETPLLSKYCATEPNLHSFETRYQHENYYLNTSPEFAMKRLLAEHKLPIYQLCKSFRVDELGPNHNPEFTLLEWYRPGFSLSQLMDELEQLINELLIGPIHIQRESYQGLFERHAGFNPHHVSAKQCRDCAQQHTIEQPVGLVDDVDEWLDWLLTQLILPALPNDQFTYIYDYPRSQCALARLHQNESAIDVAARFELFYGEIELANGFDELTGVTEQENRFHAENLKRKQAYLPEAQIDKNFLAALEYGLPDCSGVAVGLDRLLMVCLKQKSISNVFAYPWHSC